MYMKYSISLSLATLALMGCLSSCHQDEPKTPLDVPTSGPIALSGSISTYAHGGERYGWLTVDKIGVFVLSEKGLPQTNIPYKPSKVSPITEIKGMKILSKDRSSGGEQTLLPVDPKATAGYKQGKHMVYAYTPYSDKAKDVKAIPLPSITVQDADKGTTLMTPSVDYLFAYSSTEVSAKTAAVQSLGDFKSICCQITLPWPGGFPETLVGKPCHTLTVSADHPIAYKDGATIDLTTGEIKGEMVSRITYNLPKGTLIKKSRRGGVKPASMAPAAYIVLQVPFEVAKEYTYTFTFDVEDHKFQTSMKPDNLKVEGNLNLRNISDVKAL